MNKVILMGAAGKGPGNEIYTVREKRSYVYSGS